MKQQMKDLYSTSNLPPSLKLGLLHAFEIVDNIEDANFFKKKIVKKKQKGTVKFSLHYKDSCIS